MGTVFCCCWILFRNTFDGPDGAESFGRFFVENVVPGSACFCFLFFIFALPFACVSFLFSNQLDSFNCFAARSSVLPRRRRVSWRASHAGPTCPFFVILPGFFTEFFALNIPGLSLGFSGRNLHLGEETALAIFFYFNLTTLRSIL